jgi:antitoxin (DNA-binding transcriptional repressor) of toxin-antitoxin stability system
MVGRGETVADAVPVDKFVPNEETIASAANGSIWPAVDSVTVKGL